MLSLALDDRRQVLKAQLKDRRWFRFSLVRPCVIARISLWIGAHGPLMSVVTLVLMLIVLACG